MRRALAIWLLLFAAYAATVAIRGDVADQEPHYLVMAESIVSDGDIDVADEYRTRAYDDFFDGVLTPLGVPIGGRLHEPLGLGLALLVAPAYAAGGAVAVELWLAALAALAFTCGWLLARRLVPDPWATGGALACGLSAPALGYGAAVYPELAAGGALAAALLLIDRLRERPRLRFAYTAALALAALPWLGIKYVPAALPPAVALVRFAARRGRRLVALVAAEAMLASLVFYVTLNEELFDGLTPAAALPSDVPPTGADTALDYVERLPRFVALLIGPDAGLLRWAPVFGLVGVAAWLLYRSRRERVADAVPERRDLEIMAALALAVGAAQFAVAAFGAPSVGGDEPFPPRHLVAALPCAVPLVAWAFRHAPRAGAALIALSAVGSGWVLFQLG